MRAIGTPTPPRGTMYLCCCSKMVTLFTDARATVLNRCGLLAIDSTPYVALVSFGAISDDAERANYNMIIEFVSCIGTFLVGAAGVLSYHYWLEAKWQDYTELL